MKKKIFLLLTLCLSAITINAQRNEIKVPTEVKPFIEKGSKAIAIESADLNGDGSKDYVLVFERKTSEKEDYPVVQRPLLILVRDKNNKLTEAKRNERMVMCSNCGGIFGDPFDGITVGKKTFTVNHYGGSAWRWSYKYKFNYSRIDNTWQLVRFEEQNYHNVRPMNETLTKRILTPPKDYGKVDISEFDSGDYQGDTEEDSETSMIRITPDSVGDVKIGMTVAQARKALKGFTLERTSDGEGVALIGVREGEREYAMTLYAGEADAEAKIDDSAKIGMIEVWYANYATDKGVHPRMQIKEVEKEYGKITAIMMSEIESREYAKFANQPKGLMFRLRADGKDAGNYKKGEMKTTSYTTEAYLLSIQVWGTKEIAETSEDFKTIDVSDFNKMIEKAAASNETWVKMPTMIAANLVEKFSETHRRTIEMVADSGEIAEEILVVVTDDGYTDDSVRGSQYKFQLKVNEQGIWQVISAEKAHRCWQGRGHVDYSSAPCI